MKGKLFNGRSRILIILTVFLLLFAVVFYVSLHNGVRTKEAQLQELKKQLQILQEENKALDYLINEADEAELFEHLARERGYVYPDEKIYYNVTAGD